jgi:hypothetical protein
VDLLWKSKTEVLLFFSSEEFSSSYGQHVQQVTKYIPNDLPAPFADLISKCLKLKVEERPDFGLICDQVDKVKVQLEDWTK